MQQNNGASTARIAKVESCTVRIPLDQQTSFATRRVVAREYALVRLVGDDGIEGIGFCYGGSSAGNLVTMAVRELFSPLTIGEDSSRVEWLWDRMYREAILHGRAGSVMRALSIIDMALWDRNARAAGLPLYRFLGAYADDRVPAYASGGYYLDGKSPADLGREMAGYVGLGFNAVKMKVGRLGLDEEEARIAAAREAVGPKVSLMLDANNAWRDLPTALRYMRRFEPYDPYWIEEPFSPDDIENHARLARETTVLVATGEIEAGRWRFKELLDKGAAAILQTDAAVCGGITEFLRIAAIADGYGVTLCPHWFHDLHVHLVASIPNGQFVEFFPDDQVLNFRRLVDRQLAFADGMLLLPDRPGFGFGFDTASLQHYMIDPWA
jgi:L-alanine-DL-glutamate epimerase-like enolase superfamily enzyme